MALRIGDAVTVLSSGSTTARSLSERFADTVNVRDFGAVGDGITDDTAAITATIAAASGRTVYAPSSTYIVSGHINITGIKLRGERTDGESTNGTIFKVADGTSPFDAMFYSTAPASVENIILDGNNIAERGLWLQSANSPQSGIRNVFVTKTTTAGFHYSGCQVSSNERLHAQLNAGAGFLIEDSNASVFTNIRAIANGKEGVIIQPGPLGYSSGVFIYGLDVERNGTVSAVAEVFINGPFRPCRIHDLWIETDQGIDGVHIANSTQGFSLIGGRIHANDVTTNRAIRLTGADTAYNLISNVQLGKNGGAHGTYVDVLEENGAHDNTGNDVWWLINATTPAPAIWESATRHSYSESAQITGTAAPTTGAWRRGDICWNNTPSLSSSGELPVGWVCITAGTPGTWTSITTPTKAVLYAQFIWDPPSITNVAGGNTTSTETTVDGAVLGDMAHAVFLQALPEGCHVYAQVVSNNTVRISIINWSSSNPLNLGNHNVRVLVQKT